MTRRGATEQAGYRAGIPGISADRCRIDGIPSPDLPVFRESAGICFRFLGDHMKRFCTVLTAAVAYLAAWQFSLGAQAPAGSPEMDALKRLAFRSIGPTNQA